MTQLARRAAIALLAVACGLTLAAGAGARPAGKVIAHGKVLAHSHGKIDLTETIALKPKTLAVKVSSSPKQPVKVQWSVVCVSGTAQNEEGENSTAQQKLGSTSVTTPATLKLAMSYKHPRSCVVAIYTTLSKAGKQKVQLIQT